MIPVICVLTSLGFFLVRAVDDHVVGQVDQGLISNALYYKFLIFHSQDIPRFMPAGEFGQVYTPEGRLLGESPNLTGRASIVRFVQPGADRPRYLTTTDSKLGTIRVLEYPLGGVPPLTLIIGQQINQAMAVSSSLVDLLLVVLPVLAVLLAGLIWFVVGRAMRRVERIRASVANISENNLDERVLSSGTGDELDELATTMNQMLGRLSGALTRERQFVADASHELRSPMASLRAALSHRSPDLDEAHLQFASALSSLQRLELLADDLLTLEQPSSRSQSPGERVDLDDLVLSEAIHLRETTSLAVDVSGVSAGQVVAREIDMARIIENLASNATRHALSEVRFALVEQDGMVRLRVTDDGPGLPASMREKVFERFFRIDSDRNRNGGGSGLGLAIVAELTHRWGGFAYVEAAVPRGACFVIELPSPPLRGALSGTYVEAESGAR
jgi:signal transduction histidine kinase